MPISHVPLRYAHNEGHTDVSYSEDGQKYISCGSDGDMRIWSQDLYEDPIHICVGDKAFGVRQKGNKLYIATSNNDVQIITFPEGDRDGILDRYVAPINSIAVSKKGDLIALAAEEMEVKLIHLNDENKKRISLTGFTGPCLSVAICPKSKFVAASGGDGKLKIWDINDNSLVKEIVCFPKINSFLNATVLCKIDFDPSNGKTLAYPDGCSIVILSTSDWSEVTTLSCPDLPEASYSIVQYSPCGEFIAASSVKGDIVIWDVKGERVNNTTKHPNKTQICAFVWNPTGLNQIIYTDVEGQLGMITGCINKQEDVSDNPEIDTIENDNEVDFGDLQFEDDDENDENVISLGKLKKQYEDSIEPELEEIRTISRRSTSRPRTPVVPLQKPFMPSSTPDHLDPRYLCWNEVGIIKNYGSIDAEPTSKTIEVDFHDSTFHSSIIMQNFQNYYMGSLSVTALAVANERHINVIPLAARTKEWTLNMEDTEEIVAIATSEDFICIGLANYIIKVCCCYGTQRAIVSVPGPIVSLSAFKDVILVAYHSGPVRESDQCICFRLIRCGREIQTQDLGMTLGPRSNLSWLGFSDCGTPSVMDSLGMLYMYPCNAWIPFCDTSKHKKGLSDNFFVTAVIETNQTMCGIKCKGTVYPVITPKPTMCEVPLEAPFAEMTTDKGRMESNLFTWSTLGILNTEKRMKETALRIFALACKTDLDQRAQEVMELLANREVTNLGIKYASRLHKKRLVSKLTELASRLVEERYEGDGADVCYDPSTSADSVIRKFSLHWKEHFEKKYTNIESLGEPSHNLENESQKSEINTTLALSEEPNDSVCSAVNKTEELQESSMTSESPKNPFLKSLKDVQPSVSNPLSLVDSEAGLHVEPDIKEVGVEKRKQPETATEAQKSKQRKLDRFMFGKRS